MATKKEIKKAGDPVVIRAKLPAEVYEQLQKECESDDRSVNYIINQILKKRYNK